MGRIEINIPAGKQHLDGRTGAGLRPQPAPGLRLRAHGPPADAAARDPRARSGLKTILNAPDLFNAAKGFTWTDLPRSFAAEPREPVRQGRHASVRQLRIVPPKYPAWLTTSGITKIQKAIAALLGVAAAADPDAPTPGRAPRHRPPTAAPTDGSDPTPPPPPTDSRRRPGVSRPPPAESAAPTSRVRATATSAVRRCTHRPRPTCILPGRGVESRAARSAAGIARAGAWRIA